MLCYPLPKIEEGYFKYGNFEFVNGNFEKQIGELKTKWGTKIKAKLELKATYSKYMLEVGN